MMIRAASAMACLLALTACTPPPERASTPTPPPPETHAPPGPRDGIAITLRPSCVDAAFPESLDVTVRFDASLAKGAPPVLRIGNAADAEALRKVIVPPSLSDEDGPIALTSKIAPGPDKETRLFFEADRRARGDVWLRYRVHGISIDVDGPRFGLRHGNFSLGGAGDGFMLLPATPDVTNLEVTWDVAHCSSIFQAESAIGAGPGPLHLRAPPDALRQAAFFFGRSTLHGLTVGDARINLSVIGDVAFDLEVAGPFITRVFMAERALFADDDKTPFYAFMRVLPQMKDKVVGGGNPFGYTSVVGPSAPWNPRMRNHIAHELLHHWIGVGLWVRDRDGVSGYWFTEGFTVHYARTILLREGLIPPSEVLDEIVRHAAAYYGHPLRGALNATLERAIDDGTGDPSLGLLAYYKGGLYAAELDAAIRAASAGARSLDDVMRALHTRAKSEPKNAAGYAEVSEDAVRAAIVAELGEAGGARFDAVVRRGDLARPPSSAFGPCFERRAVRLGELDGYTWVRNASVPDARCAETVVEPPKK